MIFGIVLTIVAVAATAAVVALVGYVLIILSTGEWDGKDDD